MSMAASRSSSAPSTSVYAAQLMTASGRSSSTRRPTARRSATSRSAWLSPTTSWFTNSAARTTSLPSIPAAPITRIFTPLGISGRPLRQDLEAGAQGFALLALGARRDAEAVRPGTEGAFAQAACEVQFVRAGLVLVGEAAFERHVAGALAAAAVAGGGLAATLALAAPRGWLEHAERCGAGVAGGVADGGAGLAAEAAAARRRRERRRAELEPLERRQQRREGPVRSGCAVVAAGDEPVVVGGAGLQPGELG